MIEAAKCIFHRLLGETSDDLERVTRNKHRCSRSEARSDKSVWPLSTSRWWWCPQANAGYVEYSMLLIHMMIMLTPSENVCSPVFSEIKSSASASPMRQSCVGPASWPAELLNQTDHDLAGNPRRRRSCSGGKTRADQPSEGRKEGSELVAEIVTGVVAAQSDQALFLFFFFFGQLLQTQMPVTRDKNTF